MFEELTDNDPRYNELIELLGEGSSFDYAIATDQYRTRRCEDYENQHESQAPPRYDVLVPIGGVDRLVLSEVVLGKDWGYKAGITKDRQGKRVAVLLVQS